MTEYFRYTGTSDDNYTFNKVYEVKDGFIKNDLGIHVTLSKSVYIYCFDNITYNFKGKTKSWLQK